MSQVEERVCPRCGNTRGYYARTLEDGREISECVSCQTRFVSGQNEPSPPLSGSDIWRWNNQPPPTISGQVRSSSGDWASATSLAIDSHNEDGVDKTEGLAKITTGAILRLSHNTDPSRFAEYEVRSNSAAGGTFTLEVVYLSGGGALPNSGTQILVLATEPA